MEEQIGIKKAKLISLDLSLHSYYIRLTLKRDANSASQDRITAYDVSMGQ